MASASTPVPPKVFISYSWSSEEHCEWVADLGTRLMADGVEVVLDQWALKHGQDVNSFMEQMVVDPTINWVLLFPMRSTQRKRMPEKAAWAPKARSFHRKYTRKSPRKNSSRYSANATRTESPAYLYPEVPAVFRLLRSCRRIGIVQWPCFATSLNRPWRPKPPLGKPPAHLFDDSAISIPAAQKARRFQDIVASGKGNPSAAFEDFTEEFLANFESLRLVYCHD